MLNLLIFGGTFDPIHMGHINVAINVQKHCNFSRFLFLPCRIPVLKNNSMVRPEQRLEMLRLALKEQPDYHFEIDRREIMRETPSYMVTTLEDYRLEFGEGVSITLLLGRDAFEQLPYWYQWEKIVLLSNILLIDRPGTVTTSPIIHNLLKQHSTLKKTDLGKKEHGLIYRFNAGLFDCSSTTIRKKISANSFTGLELAPSVAKYISENKLYLKK